MITRAPGKIVLSGAYAALLGAPAIVVAVDRYATADPWQTADFVTPEVKAVFGTTAAPRVDATPLRGEGRKLGLGSSAAILVASLAARELAQRGPLPDELLCAAVFDEALAAHRLAQGGGSGVDVAASCHGGTLIARRTGNTLRVQQTQLPPALVVAMWTADESASTPQLLAEIRELARRRPRDHDRLLSEQGHAADNAVSALRSGSATALVRALTEQRECLERLGRAARVPIVTNAVRRLDELARAEGAVVLPAGAGGGDIAVFVGPRPPSTALAGAARQWRHLPLRATLDARGVHCWDPRGEEDLAREQRVHSMDAWCGEAEIRRTTH